MLTAARGSNMLTAASGSNCSLLSQKSPKGDGLVSFHSYPVGIDPLQWAERAIG